MPVMGRAILESLRLLTATTRLLADRCIDGLVPDRERALAMAQSSPAIVTPLARVIGYDQAARVAKHAVTHRITIRQAVLDLGLEIDALDALLDVTTMTGPG